MDLVMKVWFCEACIYRAEQAVKREEEKQEKYHLAK